MAGNMTEELSGTEMLLGSQAMEKLKNARVAVFGVGGVKDIANVDIDGR